MPRFIDYVPNGVIPAVVLPFLEDYSIDEQSFRHHLSDVSGTAGITAVTINCHSTEVTSCTFDEQRRVLEIAQDEVGATIPIINGVYADGSFQAAKIAKMAQDGGASALLVFPAIPFAWGQRTEQVLEHFRRIADASDLPIVVFQYTQASQMAYSLDTLLKLVEMVPTVRAIKDSSHDVVSHERRLNALQKHGPQINVLSTNSHWLLSSLVLGCNGILSGSGSVIASLHVRLFNAVKEGDLNEASQLNALINATAEAFYAEPRIDMHNRMKEALVLMGKLPNAVVRPPLLKLSQLEIERIRTALIAAKMMPSRAERSAA
jgi:4-hydroxy-tetrahydrodipicolinate synthase